MSFSKGESQSRSTTDVWGPQQPFLRDLYGQAQEFLPQAQAQAQNLYDTTQGAWQSALNPMGNPYLQDMGQAGLNLLNENFTQNILPAIQGEAVSGMNLGGSRQGVAQGLATQGLMRAGGDYLTNLYGNQYQQDQNRALQAAAMAPMYQQMFMAPLQQYGQLLGPPTKVGSSMSDSKSLGGGIG